MANNYKKLLSILTTLFITASIFAGNGINSPYSRFGLGILCDQSFGVNRQMGGLGYALRDSRYINLMNPASIAYVDTLTMLFEAGFSLQNVNFKEGSNKINARNASFDYIAMEFRLHKGLGMSFGFLPYSNVGYSFGSRNAIESNNNGLSASSSNSYNGTGGIYQPYIALGWQPQKNLSVGIMASYIYGDISHTAATLFDDTSIRSTSRYYTMDISNYKLDFGLQYYTKVGRKNGLTLGVVYSLGHDLKADARMIEQTTLSGVVHSSDTTNLHNSFKLPHTFGFGAVYAIGNKWKVGADYTLQQWGTSDFFGSDTGKGIDRSKVSLGAEFAPGKLYGNLFQRMSYRAGAYYAQPYTEVNGKKGCEEYGVSAGFSIPIVNKHNNRSHLHISGQFIHLEPKSSGMISENYLRINIGITFNEGWFTKMKVD